MESSEYLAAITADSNALAEAVASTSLDLPVPSCPGWTLEDLVVHAGMVQRWATEIVTTTAQERPDRGEPPELASAAEYAQWFRDGAAALTSALESADPDAPLWSFSFERRVSFWFRRQAQEVSVHRWDAESAACAESAAGAANPLDAVLAADGIDEWLAMLAVRGAGALPEGEHETTVHLHCTDVEGEWLVRRSADGLDIERAHAKGDVAARGTASDLDLYLWGRVPVDSLELFGDPALLEALRLAGIRNS